MGKVIFALDKGFGADKYAYRNSQGNVKMGKVNSAIASAPDDAPDDAPYFKNKKYYLGSLALLSSTRDILNVMDYSEHQYFAPLSLWNALNDAKIDDKDVGYYVFDISLAHKQHLAEFRRELTSFTVNKTKYNLKDRITIMPQGVASRYAIDELYYKNAPDSEKNYAIIDIGQLTVDVVVIFNGKSREENASGMAHLGIVKITQGLQDHIVSNEKLGNIYSLKEVQKFLMDGKLPVFGEDFDLTEPINKLKKEYTKFLLTSLMDRHSNIFQKISKIYLVGGGVYYLDMEEMKNFKGFPVKSLTISKDAEFFNAMGSLIGVEQAIARGVIPNVNYADFNQRRN